MEALANGSVEPSGVAAQTMTEPTPHSNMQTIVEQYLEYLPQDERTPELMAELRTIAVKSMLQSRLVAQSIDRLPREVVDEYRRSESIRPNLRSLNQGHIDKTVLKVLEKLSPLGTAVDIPGPRRLTTFWQKVEATLQSIDPATVRHDRLSHRAIRALGMYILGDAAWAVVAPSINSDTTWESFKSTVEKRFGLSRDKMRWNLYNMEPRVGESTAAFVRRVEFERLALGAPTDACMQAHCARLRADKDFGERVESLRRQNDVSAPGTVATWEMVVAVADAITSGVSFIPDSNVRATALPPNVDAQTTLSAAGTTDANIATQASRAVTNSSAGSWRTPRVLNRATCAYHAAIGRTDQFHPPNSCFINPGGPEFRPNEYNRVIAELAAAGKPIPDILRMPNAPSSPNAPPSTVTQAPRTVTTSTSPMQPSTPVAQSQSQNATVSSDQEFEAYLIGRGLPSDVIRTVMQQHVDRNRGSVNATVEAGSSEQGGTQMQASILEEMVVEAGLSGGVAPVRPHNNPGSSNSRQSSSEQAAKNKRTNDSTTSTKQILQRPRQQAIAELLGTVVDLLAANEEGMDTGSDDVPLGELQRRLVNRGTSDRNRVELVESAVQTGGVPGAGRVVRLGSAAVRKPREVNLDTVVKRIRVSVPVVNGSLNDIDLRDLLLTYLLELNVRDGRATVVPSGIIIHQVEPNVFRDYHTALSGVTESNRQQVRAALAEQGIDGRGRALTTETQSGMFPELLACSVNVGQSEPEWPMPEFVEPRAFNRQGLLEWGPRQYIATVQLDNAVCQALIDTGGHASVIDATMAEKLGLDVIEAKDGDCGAYHSPGYPPQSYAGIVEGPIPVRFTAKAVLLLPYLRVVHGNRRLLILGADILCGGRPLHRWNFAGLENRTMPCGRVEGDLLFKCGDQLERAPLLNVPSVQPHATSNNRQLSTATTSNGSSVQDAQPRSESQHAVHVVAAESPSINRQNKSVRFATSVQQAPLVASTFDPEERLTQLLREMMLQEQSAGSFEATGQRVQLRSE